ncbi:MAG TPA: ROK family transcriptional regulator [Polyangia bacterium]|nr:ROK family transcriptional regulator [Polyangia bacterium]
MNTSATHATVDAAGMRAQNSSLLLKVIWRERHISRADIARVTGLSPSTVSAIVAGLQQAGLVRETGAGLSRGGRRPTMIGFCDDVFALVGVEIGASHVTVVVTDLRADVRTARWGQHSVRTDPDGAIATVRAFIDDGLRELGIAHRQVIGIGVGVPTPVRPNTPGRLSPLVSPTWPNWPAWRDHDVHEILSAAYGLPVFVENDANLGALGEQWWGVGNDGKDLTYIKIGTSVGSGHIINGELYRGAGGTAGEIGHLRMDPAGPRCPCGLTGCLTTFIGAETLVERARREVGHGGGGATIASVGDVVRAARAGDAGAGRIVADVGAHLGVAVASLMNVLNPAVVVLGGEITGAGELLLEPVRAAVRDRSLAATFDDTPIVTSNLGDKAIAVGAATMVLRAALADRALFPALAARVGTA